MIAENHQFESDDGVLCNFCGSQKNVCSANQQKQQLREQKINDIFDEFKQENKGEWGSRDIYVVTNKRSLDERTMLQQLLENDSSKTTYNDLIMNYYFLPPEVYVRSIHCTRGNTLILTTTGQVYSFGLLHECLGRNVQKKEESFTPGLITFSEKIISLATGENHVLALDLSGKIFSWGVNNNGQLGIGAKYKQRELRSGYQPQQIRGYLETVFTNIYAGFNSSFAINKHGRIFCWGSNKDGVLGLQGKAFGEAQMIKTGPWEKESEKDIVMLPNRAYFYEYRRTKEYMEQNKTNQKNIENKQLEVIKAQALQIEELQEEIFRLKYTQNAQAAPSQEQAKEPEPEKPKEKQEVSEGLKVKFEDDVTIKELTSNHEDVKRQLDILNTNIQLQEKVIVKCQREREDLEELINAAEQKEQELYREMQDMSSKQAANKVNNSMTSKQKEEAKKVETFLKHNKKVYADLRSANDYTKSLFKKNEAQQVEEIRNQEDVKNNIQDQINTLKSKKALLQSLIKQREEIISNSFLDSNKVMIFKIIKKINKIYQEAAKTELQNYVQTYDEFMEIEDIIRDSTKKLRFLNKKIIKNFKLKKNNPYYKFINNVVEIVQDNVRLREKLNNYTFAIIQQTEQRQQKFNQQYTNQQLIDVNSYFLLKKFFLRQTRWEFKLSGEQILDMESQKYKDWQQAAIDSLYKNQEEENIDDKGANKDYLEFKHELPIKQFERELQNLEDEKLYYENLKKKMNLEIDQTFAERRRFLYEKDSLQQNIEKLEKKVGDQETTLKVRDGLLKEAARFRNRLDSMDSQDEIEEQIYQRKKKQFSKENTHLRHKIDYILNNDMGPEDLEKFAQITGQNLKEEEEEEEEVTEKTQKEEQSEQTKEQQKSQRSQQYLQKSIIGVQQQKHKNMLQQLKTLSEQEQLSYQTRFNQITALESQMDDQVSYKDAPLWTDDQNRTSNLFNQSSSQVTGNTVSFSQTHSKSQASDFFNQNSPSKARRK